MKSFNLFIIYEQIDRLTEKIIKRFGKHPLETVYIVVDPGFTIMATNNEHLIDYIKKDKQLTVYEIGDKIKNIMLELIKNE